MTHKSPDCVHDDDDDSKLYDDDPVDDGQFRRRITRMIIDGSDEGSDDE